MKLGTDIHCPQSMNLTDVDDPLTYPLVLPAGQSFHLSCGISHDQPDGFGQLTFLLMPFLILTSSSGNE